MYRVVLYENHFMFPNKFNTFEEADDFIFENNLHAYITIISEDETKSDKMKEYVFTGIWSYSCYANSEDEAWDKFDTCALDEIDCDFYNIEVKEIGEDEE